MPLVPLTLSGVNTDLPPWKVPADTWTGASGVNFRDTVAQRVMGSQYIFGTANVSPIHLLNSDFAGTNFWMYAGNGAIGVVNQSSTHFDITPTVWTTPTTDIPDKWTGTILNGLPILNYETEEPMSWDRQTGNPMEGFSLNSDWPVASTCRSMRAFRDFLLAIGYDDGTTDLPVQLKWSDAADPGLLPTVWTPGADNLSGTLEFGDTPGGLTDGGPLRGNFIVYKQEATYLLQFVGGNFVFSKRKLFTTSGILARNCWAEVEGNHVVLTDSDVIRHDGQTMRTLIDAKTRKFLFDNLDQDNFANSYVFNFKSRNEVWICFPTTGQTFPDLALVWDVEADALSFRPLLGDGQGFPHIGYGNLVHDITSRIYDSQNFTYDGGSADFTYDSNLIASAVNGGLAADESADKFQQLDFGSAAAVGNIQSSLERHSLDFDASGRTKFCRKVWPRIEGDDGTVINVRVGSQMFTDEPISWGASVPFTLGTTRHTDHDVMGKYLSFEFSSTDGGLWRSTGFDADIGETAGRY